MIITDINIGAAVFLCLLTVFFFSFFFRILNVGDFLLLVGRAPRCTCPAQFVLVRVMDLSALSLLKAGTER